MEVNLSNSLPYRHIAVAADEIVEYIQQRKEGEKKSLRTRWHKFNNHCMGGVEPNTILTVAGISGSGKSSFVNSLETDLFDLNPDIDFVVLSFNFEMLSSRQVGRKLSSKLNKTTHELYSGDPSVQLSETDLINIKKEASRIKRYNIYYVDMPGSVEAIEETINKFRSTVAKNKWLLVVLDHTLLTRGKAGDTERVILSDLQKMFMRVKKIGITTVIQVSQMNRDIESVERRNNQSMHFPTRSDLFGGDSIYQASDYVLVLHRPETLSIERYGIEAWPVINKVYMHFLKNREGELAVLDFENNLKYNRIEEPKFKPKQGQLELVI